MRFCRSLTVNISVTTAICLLLAASTKLLMPTVKCMLFNHPSNYHYLLTKTKATLVFLVHAVTLPGTLAMARYLLQRLHVHFQTFMHTKGWTSQEVAQSFHLCRVYSLFLAKTRMISHSSSLLSSSGSLKSSSNTPHKTCQSSGSTTFFMAPCIK